MFDSSNMTHAFDMNFSQKNAEAISHTSYFAELVEEDKAIDTFGCLGCAGTMGGCFGCLGTAGCCC